MSRESIVQKLLRKPKKKSIKSPYSVQWDCGSKNTSWYHPDLVLNQLYPGVHIKYPGVDIKICEFLEKKKASSIAFILKERSIILNNVATHLWNRADISKL